MLYDVGIRSEPEGRTGFAHLFEHLMFQGSANLEKLEHFRYVQSSGGTFNGSTHFDYTNYFEALPSNALERGLFLEADRMRSPRITEENLANQLEVVKNEIRVNVMNRPYGGFPWIYLPAVLFDTFANSHNGYGGFEDLESATIDDAKDFFDRYYAPANAVLAVAGDLDVDDTLGLIEKHFGRDQEAQGAEAAELRRAGPDRRAARDASRRARADPGRRDRLPGARPGRRLRRAARAPAARPRCSATATPSRLQRRLVQRDHLVTDIAAYIGEFGDPFDERDPTALTVTRALPRRGGARTRSCAAIDEELARIADDGLEPGELDRVRTRLVSVMLRDLDAVISRTLELAKFELIHGRAELIAELPARLAAVTDDDVRAAAAALRPDAEPCSNSSPEVRDEPRRAVPALTKPKRAAKTLRSAETILDNGAAGRRRPQARRARSSRCGCACRSCRPSRRTRPRRRCSPRRCSPAPASSTAPASPPPCRGWAPTCTPRSTPTGSCSAATCSAANLAPAARSRRVGADRAGLRHGRGRHRARPRWSRS